jgi:hypothetical protein
MTGRTQAETRPLIGNWLERQGLSSLLAADAADTASAEAVWGNEGGALGTNRRAESGDNGPLKSKDKTALTIDYLRLRKDGGFSAFTTRTFTSSEEGRDWIAANIPASELHHVRAQLNGRQIEGMELLSLIGSPQ